LLEIEFPLYGICGVYYNLLVGTQLPANSKGRPNCISTFTKKPIKGLYYLVDSVSTAITIEEALEWAFVNRYTPFNNGYLINPF